jgi:preprotein translocase subunit YajC
MDQYSSLVSFGIIAVAFYFLLIRPQMKRQKQHAQLMASLEVGDRIITAGGAYGTITEVHDDRVAVEVAAGVVIEYARSAIGQKIEA